MLQTYMVLKKTYSMILLLFSVQDRTKAAAATAKLLQSCPTLRPHRRQPTRLLCPWDSPGKNTGVGCHFLLRPWSILKTFSALKFTTIKLCICQFPDMRFNVSCHFLILRTGYCDFNSCSISCLSFHCSLFPALKSIQRSLFNGLC